jgi:hypothetical protein
MKILNLIAILMLLISCTNTDLAPKKQITQQGNCPQNTEFDPNVKPCTIQLTIYDRKTQKILPNVIVQLDHDGKNTKSDINGHVVFNNLTTGTHSVHIFSPTDMTWKSFYNIPVDETTGYELGDIKLSTFNSVFIPDSTPIISSINFKGNITNTDPTSSISIKYFTDKPNSGCNYTIQGNPRFYKSNCFYSVNVGVPVSNEFWFFENVKDLISGDSILSNAFHLGNFVSSTTNNSTQLVNNDIQFITNTNKFTPLIQFDSFNIPTGFKLTRLDIEGNLSSYIQSIGLLPSSRGEILNLYSKILDNLDANPSFSAYIPAAFNLTKTKITLETESGINKTFYWSYTNHYPINSTGIAFSPILSPIPTLIADQQGDVISWNSNTALTKQRIWISSQTGNTPARWYIYIIGNTDNIKLPVIPNNVTPLLITGTKYNIELSGEAKYTTAKGIGMALEKFHHIYITWTR